MARERATEADWERYYRRADRLRSVCGDPLRHHLARLAARERALLLAFTVFMLVAIAAFLTLAAQP